MYIVEIVYRYWGFLKLKEWLFRIFVELFLIVYRWFKSFCDKLVSMKFKEKVKEEDINGCKLCGCIGCSWCWKIDLIMIFLDLKGECIFKIYYRLDCYFVWVINMIKCKICKLLYIGKSEMKCNIRFNNYWSYIRNFINSCELSEYFLYNRWIYDFENDVMIMFIE